MANAPAGPIPLATGQDAVDAIVAQSGRTFVQIRTTFVQQGEKGNPSPGPLARFVKDRADRALDLYLLMRLLAVSDPFDATLPAAGWARALDIRGPSAEATVSRIWSRLVAYKLVERGRARNMASMKPLMEDGSGDPYVRVTEKDRYLRLPVPFWGADKALYRRLDLPAKAMLLIALSRPPGFILPSAKVPQWYGISEDTAERGFRQLRNVGVLEFEDRHKKAPLSKTGYATDRLYTLQGAFYLPREKATRRARATTATA